MRSTRRIPSRILSTSLSDFPFFFVGDSEVALGTCPACAGRHRPHTYSDGCKKATISEADDRKEKHDHQEQAEGASPDRVLHELPRDDGETHPTASSSNDPRPPGLEPQLGADLEPMPRERSSTEQSAHDSQMPIKDTSLAMKRLLIRL